MSLNQVCTSELLIFFAPSLRCSWRAIRLRGIVRGVILATRRTFPSRGDVLLYCNDATVSSTCGFAHRLKFRPRLHLTMKYEVRSTVHLLQAQVQVCRVGGWNGLQRRNALSRWPWPGRLLQRTRQYFVLYSTLYFTVLHQQQAMDPLKLGIVTAPLRASPDYTETGRSQNTVANGHAIICIFPGFLSRQADTNSCHYFRRESDHPWHEPSEHMVCSSTKNSVVPATLREGSRAFQSLYFRTR